MQINKPEIIIKILSQQKRILANTIFVCIYIYIYSDDEVMDRYMKI